jgi:hypothetical protein
MGCKRCVLLGSVSERITNEKDWEDGYLEDSDTRPMYEYCTSGSEGQWPNSVIAKVNPVYRPYLRDNRVSFQHGRLVAFQKLSMSNRPLVLVIVPRSLQRLIFEAYHASPSSGHLGEYKKLHRIRL